MDLYDAVEVVVRKLYRNAGFQIIDPKKGRVKIRTLQGEFMTFWTRDGWGFAPVDNPEDVHYTIHTKRKIPKQTAFLHLLMSFIEEPAEFHEKVKGKVTKRFKWRDGFKPFGEFVEERRKQRRK